MAEIKYKIIRHRNPKGKTTWWRAVYYDEQNRAHKSPCYKGQASWARRAAQNWLYANIHIWCKIANIEQRVVDEEGKSQIVQQGTQEII